MNRLQTILTATAVAGTLDILSAFVFAGTAGTGPIEVLQFVASGPFGNRALTAPGFAMLGLIVHYAIMVCMVAAFYFVANRHPWPRDNPLLAGIVYGLALWGMMYWIVMPLRWPAIPRPHVALSIAKQLFSHIVLVGVPVATICARGLNQQRLR